ncbi:MAG: hypothetical protein AAFY72_03140, partial [Cyanobacteria bacterium J06649_4]
MPAARPIHQSYTAGSCKLEVVSQPSALSQWTARPVAQQLTFKLWLQNTNISSANGLENNDLTLVAEGDRTTLQTITQYVQTKTRSTLALVA